MAPTNHCDVMGPVHGDAPAQIPLRVCHTTGVTSSLSITADCEEIAYRLMPAGFVFIDLVPVLRISTSPVESEIAVDNPERFGGQTTDGYASLNLLVDVVTLSRLLTAIVATVASAIKNARSVLMQAPSLKSRVFYDRQVAQVRQLSPRQSERRRSKHASEFRRGKP